MVWHCVREGAVIVPLFLGARAAGSSGTKWGVYVFLASADIYCISVNCQSGWQPGCTCVCVWGGTVAVNVSHLFPRKQITGAVK